MRYIRRLEITPPYPSSRFNCKYLFDEEGYPEGVFNWNSWISVCRMLRTIKSLKDLGLCRLIHKDLTALEPAEVEAFIAPIAELLRLSDIVRFALHVTLGESRLCLGDASTETRKTTIERASRIQQEYIHAFFNRLLENTTPVKMAAHVRHGNSMLYYKDGKHFKEREVMVIEAMITAQERQTAVK